MKKIAITSFCFSVFIFSFLSSGCFHTAYLSDLDKPKPRSELCALIVRMDCNSKPFQLHSIAGKTFTNTTILYVSPGKYNIDYIYSDMAVTQKKTTRYFGKMPETEYVTRVNNRSKMRTNYSFDKGNIYSWDCEKGFVFTGKKIPEKK